MPPFQGGFRLPGENAAWHAGFPARREHFKACVFVAIIDFGETAQRNRQIAGSDKNKIDARRARDGFGLLHALRGFDHDGNDRPLHRRLIISREITAQRTHAPARTAALRRKARG